MCLDEISVEEQEILQSKVQSEKLTHWKHKESPRLYKHKKTRNKTESWCFFGGVCFLFCFFSSLTSTTEEHKPPIIYISVKRPERSVICRIASQVKHLKPNWKNKTTKMNKHLKKYIYIFLVFVCNNYNRG